jgi:hypothetical protein
MDIYDYVRICTYINIHINIYIFIYMFIHIHIKADNLHVLLFTCLYICMYIYIFIYIYVYQTLSIHKEFANIAMDNFPKSYIGSVNINNKNQSKKQMKLKYELKGVYKLAIVDSGIYMRKNRSYILSELINIKNNLSVNPDFFYSGFNKILCCLAYSKNEILNYFIHTDQYEDIHKDYRNFYVVENYYGYNIMNLLSMIFQLISYIEKHYDQDDINISEYYNIDDYIHYKQYDSVYNKNKNIRGLYIDSFDNENDTFDMLCAKCSDDDPLLAPSLNKLKNSFNKFIYYSKFNDNDSDSHNNQKIDNSDDQNNNDVDTNDLFTSILEFKQTWEVIIMFVSSSNYNNGNNNTTNIHDPDVRNPNRREGTYTYMHICMYMYIHVCIHIYVCMYICI